MKVKSFSYKKGIQLPKINVDNLEETKVLDAPEYVYISTQQIKGNNLKPVVVSGDEVKIGTLVAAFGDNKVYSSVSGKVERVEVLPSVYGGTSETIIIKNNFKDDKEQITISSEFYSEEICDVIKHADLVDSDGVSLINKIENKNINNIVINAITDEPFELINLDLLKFNIEEVISGAKLLIRATKSKKLTFALTKEYYKVIMNSLNTIELGEVELSVMLLPNKYPVGDEEELYAAFNKKPLSGAEKSYDKGVLIVDAYTLLCLDNLVKTGCVEHNRLISIYDQTLTVPKQINVWTRIGMNIKELIESVRENKLVGIHKVVAGGPMRGIALGDELASVTKGLKSIILLKDKIEDQAKEINCISCGRCREICPKKLSPRDIDRATENGDMVMAKKLGAELCTKCGCCSYVCPSKRHLTQRICYAKDFIETKGI